jgi:outer membrane protein OmpA-like peptidoglycan-associated protein
MLRFTHFLRLFTMLSCMALTACINNTPAPHINGLSLIQNSTLRGQSTQTGYKITALVDQAFLPRGSHLTLQMKKDLFKIAQILHQNPSLTIKISAYTDNRNAPKSSQLVSLRRAMVVADFFRNHHVKSNRISIHGMGVADPVASNTTAQGRAANRRIEMLLS